MHFSLLSLYSLMCITGTGPNTRLGSKLTIAIIELHLKQLILACEDTGILSIRFNG